MSPLVRLVIGLVAPQLIACQSDQVFDYVIVGAGPAGLVLANKLSADPNTTVAVIEAGDQQFSNPNVTDASALFVGLGTPIDWAYTSAPQKYVNNKTLTYNAGKALGGTTTINGMTYIRAEKEQIDAWEDLGNEGWNWDALFRYYVQQEHFQPPDAEKAVEGATFVEEYHGFTGELSVGWGASYMEQGMFEILKNASENMGLKWNKDVNSGRMDGFTRWPFTLHASTNIRQDAARAYYYPVAQQRPNMHVFVNTTALRIIWDESAGYESVTAKGVEVLPATKNTTNIIQASKEVILSAGSLRSPALLEHSGIGNPSILSSLGLDTTVNLPSVGANFQDQPNIAISYASPTNWTGYPSFVTFVTAADLFGEDLTTITAELRANATQYAELIVSDAPHGQTTIEVEEKLINKQIDLVFTPNSTVPLAELIYFPQGNAITVVHWNLLPFSRGSIHITSPSPTTLPSIDPNHLQLPIDTLVQAAAAVTLRKMFATAPLSQHVTAEVLPGFETVPENTGYADARWGDWIKQVFGVNNHPVGSTAMRAREFGGVLDKEGRVYGTSNVRVVDAGSLPLQTSGHLSGTVYAVAGKIADAILREGRGDACVL
ncbi:alcohol oxidase [Massarina eburnea CBS 473.64]|uniref:Alcohol oxidase n=1 Tax=Massarina eburnea CBS 473.64 TaxID=1395130 RepID=A0A6A6SG63_9PLEO|nr:alcohol oxidase [Massarina eburnea CBS 473.64]